MRGTHNLFRGFQSLTGIIPAYAGNTRRAIFARWDTGDHPRVCGEHFDTIMERNEKAGSSPRMRGTLLMRCRPRSASGIIPAYAGNTIIGKYFVENNGDHPRVCGEHTKLA